MMINCKHLKNYLTCMCLFCAVNGSGGCIWGGGWRPAADTVLSPVRVEYVGVDGKDEWILDCDLYISAISGVRSDSAYGLLTLIPRHQLPPLDPELSKHEFLLSGFSGPRVKPVYFDVTKIGKGSQQPEMVILDFLGSSIAKDIESTTITIGSGHHTE